MNNKTAEDLIKPLTHPAYECLDDDNIVYVGDAIDAMEEYASPLKKRIEELEAGLKQIKVICNTDGDFYTLKIINDLLNQSTNGKQG